MRFQTLLVALKVSIGVELTLRGWNPLITPSEQELIRERYEPRPLRVIPWDIVRRAYSFAHAPQVKHPQKRPSHQSFGRIG